MYQAARSEISRLRQLHRGTELELLALTERRQPSAAEQAARRGLEQRALQLKSRIEWFERVLRDGQSAAG